MLPIFKSNRLTAATLLRCHPSDGASLLRYGPSRFFPRRVSIAAISGHVWLPTHEAAYQTAYASNLKVSVVACFCKIRLLDERSPCGVFPAARVAELVPRVSLYSCLRHAIRTHGCALTRHAWTSWFRHEHSWQPQDLALGPV